MDAANAAQKEEKMNEIKVLFDFSKNPQSLYIGSSVFDVEINPETYKINCDNRIKVMAKHFELYDLINKYSEVINYRVNVTNTSTNIMENVSCNFCGVKFNREFYVFQTSCIEISNECYQIDLHKIFVINI